MNNTESLNIERSFRVQSSAMSDQDEMEDAPPRPPFPRSYQPALSLPTGVDREMDGKEFARKRRTGNMQKEMSRSTPSLLLAGTLSQPSVIRLPRSTSWQNVLERVIRNETSPVDGAEDGEPETNERDIRTRTADGTRSRSTDPPCRTNISPSRDSTGYPGRFVNEAFEVDIPLHAEPPSDQRDRVREEEDRRWETRSALVGTTAGPDGTSEEMSQHFEMSHLRTRSFEERDTGNTPDIEEDTLGLPESKCAPPSYRQAVGVDSVERSRVHEPQEDVEQGDTGRCPGCDSCGPFGSICSNCRSHLPSGVHAKIALLVVGIACLAVFIGMMSTSFVYVEYHQLALVRTKSTGAIEENTVYPGCYVLGPDKEFKYFQSSVYHLVFPHVSVYSGDGMPVEITCDVMIKLRPEEIGQLYRKFKLDFLSTFKPIILSTIKNTVPNYKLDDFRFKRDDIERDIHEQLTLRLGGDCCPECCDSNKQTCSHRKICSQCSPPGQCKQAYHADVPYFQLGELTLNDDILSRFLTRVVLQIQAETEYFIQEHAVAVIEIDREVKYIINEANIVLANATNQAAKIRAFAETEAEAITQTAEMTALKSMCSDLNLTQEDHKMSLYFIHTLEHTPELYRVADYDKLSAYRTAP